MARASRIPSLLFFKIGRRIFLVHLKRLMKLHLICSAEWLTLRHFSILTVSYQRNVQEFCSPVFWEEFKALTPMIMYYKLNYSRHCKILLIKLTFPSLIPGRSFKFIATKQYSFPIPFDWTYLKLKKKKFQLLALWILTNYHLPMPT